jgi:hypothetical protein
MERGIIRGCFPQLQTFIGIRNRREGSMFIMLEACGRYEEGIFGFVSFF